MLSCRGGKYLSIIGDLGRGVQENLHPGPPLKIPLHGGSWALNADKHESTASQGPVVNF